MRGDVLNNGFNMIAIIDKESNVEERRKHLNYVKSFFGKNAEYFNFISIRDFPYNDISSGVKGIFIFEDLFSDNLCLMLLGICKNRGIPVIFLNDSI